MVVAAWCAAAYSSACMAAVSASRMPADMSCPCDMEMSSGAAASSVEVDVEGHMSWEARCGTAPVSPASLLVVLGGASEPNRVRSICSFTFIAASCCMNRSGWVTCTLVRYWVDAVLEILDDAAGWWESIDRRGRQPTADSFCNYY